MYLHDRGNTQYNSRTSGPSTPVGVAWAFETGGRVLSSPAVLDETVYIGSSDGSLYAIDMVTGEQQWSFETGGPVLSSPAVVDGTVYVGSNDNNVNALNADTGEKQWAFQTGGKVRSSPTLGERPKGEPTDQVLAIGSDDGKFYLLNPRTGEKQYELDTGGPVVSTPALFTGHWNGTENLWYTFASTDGFRYGSWATPLGGSSDESYEAPFKRDFGAPIYSSRTTLPTEPADGFLSLFGTDDGRLHKEDEGDDRPWEFETDGKIRASPALAKGIVYFGSWDQHVYAVDEPTGDQQWAFETDGKVESSPAVADEVVYFGSADHHVYALDSESGDRIWDFRTGGEVLSSPAVVSGTVFVGSNDGSVYALTACQ